QPPRLTWRGPRAQTATGTTMRGATRRRHRRDDMRRGGGIIAMITVNQLHPLFFGEIVGADLKAEPTPALRDAVQEAMDRFAVCVVRQGPITDAEHIRFGRLF